MIPRLIILLTLCLCSCSYSRQHRIRVGDPAASSAIKYRCPYPDSGQNADHFKNDLAMSNNNQNSSILISRLTIDGSKEQSTSSFTDYASVVSQTSSISETGLYSDLSTKTVATQNLRFDPQYPLWTDGSTKVRWISFPKNSKVDTSNPDRWVFPVGTKTWKQFSHKNGNQETLVETRFMEKIAKCADDEHNAEKMSEKNISSCWNFAVYWWNSDQTDAFKITSEDWSAPDKANVITTQTMTVASKGTKSHKIPPRSACTACHAGGGDPVLGFDYIQLSSAIDPNTKKEVSNAPSDSKKLNQIINAFSAPLDTAIKISSSPAQRTAVGYLHGNCGSCHSRDGGYAVKNWSLNMDLRFNSKASDGANLLATLLNQNIETTSIDGQDFSFRIHGGSPEKSALFYRMNFRDQGPTEIGSSVQMPPIGSEVVDSWSTTKVSDWIKELPAPN